MLINKPRSPRPDPTVDCLNPMLLESQDYNSGTPSRNQKKSFRETYYENQYKKLKDKMLDSIHDQEIHPVQDFRKNPVFQIIENTTEKLQILKKRQDLTTLEIL